MYYFSFYKIAFLYRIVSRSSGYENDAVSQPILASRVGITGYGSKQSENIILEVSGTNNGLGFEEVNRDGLYFHRLKPDNNGVIQFKICGFSHSC